jgi:hypothetical protein
MEEIIYEDSLVFTESPENRSQSGYGIIKLLLALGWWKMGNMVGQRPSKGAGPTKKLVLPSPGSSQTEKPLLSVKRERSEI